MIDELRDSFLHPDTIRGFTIAGGELRILRNAFQHVILFYIISVSHHS